MIKRILRSSATHIAFAFIVMGGWAIFANRDHPMPQPIIAGLVQGMLSGTITLFLKRALELLFVRFEQKSALWAPPLIACSVSLCVLIGVHMVMRTPEILNTVAVPFSVATIYAALYNFSLFKQKGQQNGG